MYTRILLSSLLLLLSQLASAAEAPSQSDREELWTEVAAEMRETARDVGHAELSPRVLAALREVPREAFVPQDLQDRAYENRPLPIGHGQTISQPFIVAIMTELLELEPGDRVFELGTGSGYQAAVLSRLVSRVYSMEIVEPLGKGAAQTLQNLGYDNVEVRIGDGYLGWEQHAPFDAIIVTAAGDHIPPPLVAQLKPGGRMLIPVGSRFFTQQLVLLHKQSDGSVETRELLPVAFVPITGGH